MNRGRLKQWHDDRGFGFIQPDEGNSDVFLHISALSKLSRRPQVGDIITYQLSRNPQGKLQANRATIAGVTASQPRSSGRSSAKSATPAPVFQGSVQGFAWGIVVLLVPVVVGASVYYWLKDNGPPPAIVQAKPNAPVAATPPPAAVNRPAATPKPTPTPIARPTLNPNANGSGVTVTSANSPQGSSNAGCNIKGNISISDSKKFYHVPGMPEYEGTRIQPEHGERWFCTEAEAIAAGWTQAPRPR
ncbi:cold shock domain-containing protein [Prochlorothrix hollandica]|uniref:cold shock domain-containing protein n=1 Tax=Prochlorothrix hollandica TaxID=1223 RepID=UPI00333FE4F4